MRVTTGGGKVTPGLISVLLDSVCRSNLLTKQIIEMLGFGLVRLHVSILVPVAAPHTHPHRAWRRVRACYLDSGCGPTSVSTEYELFVLPAVEAFVGLKEVLHLRQKLTVELVNLFLSRLIALSHLDRCA